MTEIPMKYAHVERERRFLVSSLPDLAAARRVVTIHDRYLTGTRLRLRAVQEKGEPVVTKLGHKVRLDPGSGAELAHTSMYLDDRESSVIAALPSRELTKVRHLLPVDASLDVAVDVFRGALDGLVLAEIDLGDSHQSPPPLPGWLGPEVTDDDRFTGGALASLTPEAARALVAGVVGARPAG